MELGRKDVIEWMTPLWKDRMLRLPLSFRPSCVRNARGDLGLALSTQQAGYVLKPCESEASRLPKILFGELLTSGQIGRPVPATALFGFLACSIAAALASEGKGGDSIQPGKPGRTLRSNPESLVVTGLVKFVFLCRGRPGQRVDGGFRHQIPLLR